MKRTYDANIGGTIFHVEEDAYHRLEVYLESVKAHFRSYPDSVDIVADIESRIAEQCAQRGPTLRVVTLADVEAIIGVMGSVDQFDDSVAPEPAHGGATAGATAEAEVPSPRWHQLLRDPDHKMIAGVAAGVARHCGVAPRWIRLAFLSPLLLLIFLGVTSMARVGEDDLSRTATFEVLAYILLWLFIPRAKTTAGPTAEASPTGRRRLFRDPDNMLVAGVATGVARYCGIPSRIVRFAFFAPVPLMLLTSMINVTQFQGEDVTKVGTFEVVIYLLLWLCIPLAKTSIDKLKMRGHAVTLATVAQQVRDETPQTSQSGATGLMAAIGLTVRTLVLGTAWITGFLLAAWAVITTIGLTVFLTVVMTNPALIPFTRELVSAKAMGFKFYPFAICCYLLAVIPLVLIGTVVVTELQKRRGVQWNRPSTSVYVTSMAVWMVALIAWAWLWASSVKPENIDGLFSYQTECTMIQYDSTGSIKDSVTQRTTEVLPDGSRRTTIVLKDGLRIVRSDGDTTCEWSSE